MARFLLVGLLTSGGFFISQFQSLSVIWVLIDFSWKQKTWVFLILLIPKRTHLVS